MPIIETVTSIARRVLGTTNEVQLRRYAPLVDKVRGLESRMQELDDVELRRLSATLRERVAKGEGLEAVLVEALALAREVADRRVGMWRAVLPEGMGLVLKPVPEAERFPDDAWGEARAAVEQVRNALRSERSAERPGVMPWDLDLPAAAYAAIRRLYPESLPPFRMRAHDVQVLGAMVLHQGRIAEMKTGEGKTLVASLTCYLNALSGKGVHVVTVNDYLAQRDAAWNEPTLRFLGCTVGAIQSQMPPHLRRDIYARDVVYGTNTEFGFDYLRDNLAKSQEEQVQTRRTFAIVDEVDSILIDEARTPLIISGPAVGRKAFYEKADEVAASLRKGEHFETDIKDRHVTLTEAGMDEAAKLFGVSSLYDSENMHLPHFLDNAMKAHQLYQRDKEYLVVDGEVKIVDEHTGRIMEGRRWSDGLHQAIEAKEKVPIQEENQTYATITLQNFFRLYDKLAGMTGTAMTEANEFNAIYKLQVIAIPPNKPVRRADLSDLIFGTEKEKFDAIVKEVEELHAVGQPVLVGTISVDVSERLSEHFKRRGIPHEVLNARQHQREADIVTRAGAFGSVTIATNMAGRGTDIVLGRTSFEKAWKHWQERDLAPKRLRHDAPELDEAATDLWLKHFLGEEQAAKLVAKGKGKTPAERLKLINEHRRQLGLPNLPMPSSLGAAVDVRSLGGLRILGTERHDSRRIDNQLRGRSGRQGDPGSSRFYMSLEDDLMKRFAGPTMANLMRRMGLKDGVPIESGMVSNAVEKAQKKVEEYHYGIRKNLLEYDQVMNSQRTLIYRQRQQIIGGKDLEKILVDLFRQALDDLVQRSASDGLRGPELAKRISEGFAKDLALPAPDPEKIPVKDGGDACLTHLLPQVEAGITARKQEFGEEMFPTVLRFVLLDTIDRRWRDHLYAMDHLRHAIGLEAYAQKDPRLRYKEEGFRHFMAMNELMRLDVARMFFRLQIQVQAPEERGPAANLAAGGFAPVGTPVPADGPRPKPRPNDPCPCGSGLPFRKCHG